MLKGRVGGDYDLARLLKRTRWGGGSGRSVSERGCSVADIVASIDDPLSRGSRFKEVRVLGYGAWRGRFCRRGHIYPYSFRSVVEAASFYFSSVFGINSVHTLFLWPCTAINVSVHYNDGLLPDIILLTQCYYHRGTRLIAMKRFCLCSLCNNNFKYIVGNTGMY